VFHTFPSFTNATFLRVIPIPHNAEKFKFEFGMYKLIKLSAYSGKLDTKPQYIVFTQDQTYIRCKYWLGKT
jgi:hypothetical protein